MENSSQPSISSLFFFPFRQFKKKKNEDQNVQYSQKICSTTVKAVKEKRRLSKAFLKMSIFQKPIGSISLSTRLNTFFTSPKVQYGKFVRIVKANQHFSISEFPIEKCERLFLSYTQFQIRKFI